MKLHEFRARDVFGHLNISILFDRNPHIVIAPNGAGKTTALRLMQALMTPDLRDLLVTEFQEISIRFDDNTGSDRLISARRTKSTLVVGVSDREGELVVPLELLSAIEAEISGYQRHTESSRALRLKYADNEIFRAISEVNMPVFLGLDRRGAVVDETLEHREYVYRPSHRRAGASRFAANSLSASLRESQDLILSAYRRARRIQDYRANKLRKALLLTGFEYIELEFKRPETFGFDHKSLSIADLEQQRCELLVALRSVGIESQEAEKELNPFFEKVKLLLTRLHSGKGNVTEDGEAMFEAMLNRASLIRLRRLVDAVREFNEDSAGLNQKFKRFVDCLNFFFEDSHKSVQVDSVGVLKFEMGSRVDQPLEALSSGEQQLVIMFTHLFFSAFGDKSNVFVIDEPELSLHLRWQEVLLDKMIESSPRAQIIVATHSPEIVGDRLENCTGIRQ